MNAKMAFNLDVPEAESKLIQEIEDDLVDSRVCVNESPYHYSKFCVLPEFGIPDGIMFDCNDCPVLEEDVNGLG